MANKARNPVANQAMTLDLDYLNRQLAADVAQKAADNAYREKYMQLIEQGKLDLEAKQLAQQYALAVGQLELDRAKGMSDIALNQRRQDFEERWRTAEQTGFIQGAPTLDREKFWEQQRQSDVSAVMNAPRGPADFAAYVARIRGLANRGMLPESVARIATGQPIASFSDEGYRPHVMTNTEMANRLIGLGGGWGGGLHGELPPGTGAVGDQPMSAAGLDPNSGAAQALAAAPTAAQTWANVSQVRGQTMDANGNLREAPPLPWVPRRPTTATFVADSSQISAAPGGRGGTVAVGPVAATPVSRAAGVGAGGGSAWPAPTPRTPSGVTTVPAQMSTLTGQGYYSEPTPSYDVYGSDGKAGAAMRLFGGGMPSNSPYQPVDVTPEDRAAGSGGSGGGGEPAIPLRGTDYSWQQWQKLFPTEQQYAMGVLEEAGGETPDDFLAGMRRAAPNFAQSRRARFSY